jgi:hypothetical protein
MEQRRVGKAAQKRKGESASEIEEQNPAQHDLAHLEAQA